MAPEFLRDVDKSFLDRADIFSLGAMVYEILRGKDLPCNGTEWM